MEYVLTANLVGEDRLAGLLIDPTADVDEQGPPVVEARPRSNTGFGLSFLVMFLLFFTITLSGGYMLQSVVKEKENRTAEVLLVSLDPQELMAGKVVGLGSLALVQMVIWLGGMALLGTGAVLLANLGDLTMPPGFVVWALLFFLGGYVVYASALGALGALAPNLREGSQFTFAIILPLLIPLWFNSVFITAPNGPLATAFSLFPLTAPTAMVTRMAATEVPLWQVVVSLVGLAITAVVFLRMAARFFRADTLLSEEKLDWRRVGGGGGGVGGGVWGTNAWTVNVWTTNARRFTKGTKREGREG
jgi:ABC-2 type transport system permease protein